jgi:hypothetical protein
LSTAKTENAKEKLKKGGTVTVNSQKEKRKNSKAGSSICDDQKKYFKKLSVALS